MLAELTIRDFAIIERLDLTFDAGFNVFTGETGAGKSIIIDAVSLLLGGRADGSVIRAGAREAAIEGIFHLHPEEHALLGSLLESDSLQHEEPGILILAREIRLTGHNVCRVNGRAVRLSLLEEVARHLVDIHGQGEHLSLLQERTHLDFLDRYGRLEGERAAVGEQVRVWNAVRRELRDLKSSERELSRRTDLLRYQIGEIRAARLEVGEDETLLQERNRLANAEKLLALSSEVLALLAEGQDDRASVIDLLGQASRVMSGLARVDPQMEAYHQQIEDLEYRCDDLLTALRSYGDEIEFNPTRLNQVEERLALIHRLKKKYGDSIEEILAFAARSVTELERIEHSEERVAALEAQEEALLRQIGEMGATLSARRRETGALLSAAVEAELNELKMEGTRFAVDIRWTEQADGAVVEHPSPEYAPGRYGFDQSGLDQVAFLLSPNVGEPLKSMAKVASGGETSRLMLALKTALAQADRIPTLIFDEIDQGIGGRVGGVVGSKLRGLTRSDGGVKRQVFCVTHLPQLAGYADLHLHVRKSVSGGRTRTAVDALDREARITELSRMLGDESENARRIARELLTING